MVAWHIINAPRKHEGLAMKELPKYGKLESSNLMELYNVKMPKERAVQQKWFFNDFWGKITF
jgi:hypothetical protein